MIICYAILKFSYLSSCSELVASIPRSTLCFQANFLTLNSFEGQGCKLVAAVASYSSNNVFLRSLTVFNQSSYPLHSFLNHAIL